MRALFIDKLFPGYTCYNNNNDNNNSTKKKKNEENLDFHKSSQSFVFITRRMKDDLSRLRKPGESLLIFTFFVLFQYLFVDTTKTALLPLIYLFRG